MRLYVGNLSYTTTEDTLREAFSNYGDVVSVTIIKDYVTGQSKGFGFVEMQTDIMGERGIGGMNGKDIDGRRLRVSIAVDKPQREGEARKFFKNSENDFHRPRNFSKDRPRRDSSRRFSRKSEEYSNNADEY
ncbi:MAG: RNA-binding protein [Treponema sp.]|nr:RNA-binding protein [Treponema sp.]